MLLDLSMSILSPTWWTCTYRRHALPSLRSDLILHVRFFKLGSNRVCIRWGVAVRDLSLPAYSHAGLLCHNPNPNPNCVALLLRSMSSMPQQASCLVNPRAGYETTLNLKPVPVDKRKRIAVVGSGPAGLAAATGCAERGHSVTLFERASDIGGQVIARGSRSDLVLGGFGK